jgi:PLP dependent protein
MGQIENNLKALELRIENAYREFGRNRGEITLVAVSKTVALERIMEASQAGLTDFGENKVQEASDKIPRFTETGQKAIWHMIGHLQTNKAKQAIKLFDIIESVDSIKLAQVINTEAAAENRTVEILLEVNSTGDPSKYGFSPEEIITASEAINNLSNLRLSGLMTVGPFTEDQDKIDTAFGNTEILFTQMKSKFGENIKTLSMGMSDDLECAIKHGTTELRIGTAIFGIRHHGDDSSLTPGGHTAI